jgi:hypothetical protein
MALIAQTIAISLVMLKVRQKFSRDVWKYKLDWAQSETNLKIPCNSVPTSRGCSEVCLAHLQCLVYRVASVGNGNTHESDIRNAPSALNPEAGATKQIQHQEREGPKGLNETLPSPCHALQAKPAAVAPATRGPEMCSTPPSSNILDLRSHHTQ